MIVQPRSVLAAGFLALQFGLVLYAQFTPRRYFCWAPNDYANTFALHVKVRGVELTEEQALGRYHMLGRKSSYENPATHIMDTVRQYEETYGRHDDAHVTLEWSLNGHAKQTWQWPQDRE